MRRMTAIAICAVIAGVLWPSPGSAQNDRVSEMVRQANGLRDFCTGTFDDPAEFEYKECDRGIGIAEAAHRLDPANVAALVVLVDMLESRSREKWADAARELLALDPDNGHALEALYLTSRAPEERLRYLRRWAEADPEARLANGELARAEFQATGDVTKALESIKRQIAISAGEESIWHLYSEFRRRGHTEAMVEVLEALLGSSGDPATRCDRFFSFYSSFDREEILADSHQLNDRYFERCGGYAFSEFAVIEEDPAKQLALLQKALVRNPADFKARGELSVRLLTTAGDVEGALREIPAVYERSIMSSERYMLRFAAALAARGERGDYVRFLAEFLSRGKKGRFKCGLLKKLGVEEYLDVPEIAEAVGAECAELLGN